MLKPALVLAIMVCLTGNSFAQYQNRLIDSATFSFCSGDTNTAIKYLELYAQRYPDEVNTILVNHRLAEFYIQMKDYKTALVRLTNSLSIEPGSGYGFKEKDSCLLFNANRFSSAKADVCVTLSKLYATQGDNAKALEYLNLADERYLPDYGGCANGMIMYRYLSFTTLCRPLRQNRRYG